MTYCDDTYLIKFHVFYAVVCVYIVLLTLWGFDELQKLFLTDKEAKIENVAEIIVKT